MMTTEKSAAIQNQAVQRPERGRLLIVDADQTAAQELARGLGARGFAVRITATVDASLEAIRANPPDHALIDLQLGKDSGLEVVRALSAACPESRIVIFSVYGGLAHTVAAIKAGAVDHLPRPASLDAIEAALLADGETLPPPIELPMGPERVRWEHVQTIFRQSGGNVSETARTLRMHRRTLQRILARGEPHG
jgi:two-component system, response regulator RegA